MRGKWTPGPWYVRDFRAAKMRELGWVGPSIDRILITNMTGQELIESGGENSVVARIQFDNRPEEMGASSLADAHLIAAAPALHDALAELRDAASEFEASRDDLRSPVSNNRLLAAIDAADAALAQARGEQP